MTFLAVGLAVDASFWRDVVLVVMFSALGLAALLTLTWVFIQMGYDVVDAAKRATKRDHITRNNRR